MFDNKDNSIKSNVDKGCNGMSEGTISIDISEYKGILELAYKAAMLKEAFLNCTKLDIFCKNELCLVSCNEVMTVFKYAFPSEYAGKLRELADDKTEDGKEEGE